MSVVKIHLPYYTKNILSEILEQSNYNKDMYVININKMGITNTKDLYKELSETIFSYPLGSKLVIIGYTQDLKLPIPQSAKIILKEKSIGINKIKHYQKLGYDPLSERTILQTELIPELIDSTHTHIGGFIGNKNKVFSYDIYKLWYLTNDIKSTNMKLIDILEHMYGTDYKKVLKTHKLWEKVTISNIKKYPEHYERLKKADLNDPVLMTLYNKIPTMIDGMHRLMKAYLMNNKTIPVIMIPRNILTKAQIKK